MAGVHQPPNAPILLSFPSAVEIITSLADFVVKAQKESIDKKGRFTIALSGGSLPMMLRGLMGHPGVKWNKWYVLLYCIFSFISTYILGKSFM